MTQWRRHLSRDLVIAGIIAVLALAVRVIYLWQYQQLPDWDQLTVDNLYHHHWAQDIASGNVVGDTTYFRAPFYVYCLALLYAVFGTSLWVGRTFGLLVGLASVVMTFALGRKLISRPVGVIAAVVHGLFPLAIYFETELLLDPLFLLLLQVAVYRLSIWLDSHRSGDLFWFGLATGLAAITRPTPLVLLVIPAAVLIFRRSTYRPLGRQVLALTVGTFLLIAPISIRNVLVAGDPVLIASQAGINMYIGNNESADGVSAVLPEPLGHNWEIRDITYIAEAESGKDLKPGEVSAYWNSRALEWIGANPMAFVRLYLAKLYYQFSNAEISNNRDLGFFFDRVPILGYNPLGFGVIFGFALVGLLIGFRSRPKVRLLGWVLVLYILPVSLFFFNSRFRLPLLPYWFVLAASGLVIIFGRIRQGGRAAVPVLAVLGLAMAFSYAGLVPSAPGTSPQALTALGNHAFAQEDYYRALEYNSRAASIDSTFPEVNLNLGNTYLRLGETERAREYYEREVRFNPSRAGAYANLASLDLVSDDIASAVSRGREALRLKPYDVTANRLLLRIVARVDTLTPAALKAEAEAAAARTGDDIYLLNEIGIMFSRRGRPEDARYFLQRALHAAAPPVEIDDEAFRYVWRYHPDNMRHQRARAAYQLGFVAGRSGDPEAALEYSRQAIGLDSTLAEAYVNLVTAHLAVGQIARADSVLTDALRRFPDQAQLRQMRAAWSQ